MFIHVAVAVAGFCVLTGGVVVPTRVGIDGLNILQYLGHIHVRRDGADHIHYCPYHSCRSVDELLLAEPKHNPTCSRNIAVTLVVLALVVGGGTFPQRVGLVVLNIDENASLLIYVGQVGFVAVTSGPQCQIVVETFESMPHDPKSQPLFAWSFLAVLALVWHNDIGTLIRNK